MRPGNSRQDWLSGTCCPCAQRPWAGEVHNGIGPRVLPAIKDWKPSAPFPRMAQVQLGVRPTVRRRSVPDPPRFQPLALRSGGSHTLRIRGAGVWKMAEGFGVNVFLASGTWKPAPGPPAQPELWVVITAVGFAFVDRDGLTPVQGWNSCLYDEVAAAAASASASPMGST